MSHAKKAVSNPNDFILPDLGEGVHEAELIKWRVSVGQYVEEHTILADMETDKALVEVPSPRSGTILVLHGAEGEILKVGNALVSFEGEGASDLASNEPEASATGPATASHAGTNGKHSPTPPPPATPAAAEREDAGTVVGAVGGALGGISAAPGKALATPAVRRLAKDLGLDIDTISGSGIGGRVLEADVRTAGSGGSAPVGRTSHPPSSAAAPTPATGAGQRSLAPAAHAPPVPPPAPRAAPSRVPPGETEVRVPIRGIRRTIANRLKESLNNTVHFTVMDEADVTALDQLRRKLAAASGEKVSFLPFVASAVCRCLAGEFSDFNSTTDDKFEEIVRHRTVNLGIATDTDNGLMVPVIRDADKLGVLELSRHIAFVANSARDRTASREALTGGTFTISNVGSHAGRFATPIINYPEVGILAVGRAREGVVVQRGMIGVGKLLPLSLACDHRVVDGASAALMLAKLVELLQNPEQLMEPARR
ncbi:MAG: dihydrolipoamide acetyltransferase family protein [Phycisphaerales bacterium]